MIRVCFHGAESTGKTVLARKLSGDFGCPFVPEFGRIYAENVTTDFTMADLLEIADEQDRLMRISSEGNPALVLLDTDPLMTAAWAHMLFAEIPDVLLEYQKADLYLLFAPDVPWVKDGTRFFGTPELRRQFAAAAEDVLKRVGVPYQTVSGDFTEREDQARQAIVRMLG